MEALKQLGVEEKEWISSRDSRVRETHESLDGDVVPRDQKFVSSSGAALAFPGDPDAPPEEVINCRCTIVGVNTQETGL
jgi:uncharacterized protein with gpF-like domain